MKIAFCGASGTGKTYLAKKVLSLLPSHWFIEVGSRTVIKELGLELPYQVDSLGRREEFQRLLLKRKTEEELKYENFITDRTAIDNLVYSELGGFADEEFRYACYNDAHRYDKVVLCRMGRYFQTGTDPARNHSISYHKEFEKKLVRHLELAGIPYTEACWSEEVDALAEALTIQAPRVPSRLFDETVSQSVADAAHRMVDSIYVELVLELARALQKHPGRRFMQVALTEEVGECARALLQGQPVRQEAVQAAVVSLRLGTSGDFSFHDITEEESVP